MRHYLHEIVCDVNNRLEIMLAPDKRFQSRSLLGIAVSQISTLNGVEVLAPYVFSFEGEGQYAGIDDTHDVSVYHRALRIRVVPSAQQQFGDGGWLRLSADMVMVVYYNQRMIQLTPDEMFLVTAGSLQYSGSLPNVKNITINLGSVVLDTQTVLNSEYRLAQVSLPAEQQLIALNYTIEGNFRTDCLNICDV